MRMHILKRMKGDRLAYINHNRKICPENKSFDEGKWRNLEGKSLQRNRQRIKKKFPSVMIRLGMQFQTRV